MEANIRIVVKHVGKPPEVAEIKNHFRAMQAIVGGLFEIVSYDIAGNEPTRETAIMVNEEGLLKDLPPNITAPAELVPLTADGCFRGPIFATAINSRTGDNVSLTDEEVAHFLALFTTYGLLTNG